MKKQSCVRVLWLIVALLSAPHAIAKDDDLASIFGSDDMVSIVTGQSMPLRTAPAVASVLTRDDIEATGYTTISELMRLVPGVFALFRFGTNDQLVVRGVRTYGNNSPDVIILIDGVPQNDTAVANLRSKIADIPLSAVERVEVIRGPYSTLYGSDAYSGVVNIITRRGRDTKTGSVDFLAGQWDTREVRWRQPMSLADGAVLSVQYRESDGFAPYFLRDNQTRLDEIIGTNISRAPNYANTSYEDISAMFDISLGNFDLRLRSRHRNAGLGVGIIASFDPDGALQEEQYNIELHHQVSFENWSLKSDLTAWRVENRPEDPWQVLPPGAFFSFPDGVQILPETIEDHYRLETSASYTGSARHSLLVGAGVEYIDMDTTERRNYMLDPSTGLPSIELPELQRVDDADGFILASERTLSFLYIDDTWNLSSDWTLTAGLRIDDYDDFGIQYHPRASLVWTTTQEFTTKLIYGTGFRAPTFLEMFGQQNPSTLGNPDLKAVNITSYGLVFDYSPAHDFHVDLSLWHHNIDNLIQYDLVTTQGIVANNSKGQEGRGFELSASWDVTDSIALTGYWSFHDTERDIEGDDVSLSPRHMYFVRADWRILPRLRANFMASYYADTRRERPDTRPDIDDYLIVDANIVYRVTDAIRGELKFSNLFDEVDSPIPNEFGANSNQDTPQLGRAAYVRLRVDY